MRMKILGNLSKTTLSADWGSGGAAGVLMTLPANALASNIIGTIADGEMAFLTLHDAVPGTGYEVIQVVRQSSNGSSYDVYRGIDGSTIKAWPSGSLVEARIPKAILEKFAQNYHTDDGLTLLVKESYPSWAPSLQKKVNDAPVRANNQSVSAGSVRIWDYDNTKALLYLKDGMTGSGMSFNDYQLAADGTSVAMWLDIDPASKTVKGKGFAAGRSADTANYQAGNLGNDGKSLAQGSFAAGSEALAAARYSLALGNKAKVFADDAVAIGKCRSVVPRGLAVGVIASKWRNHNDFFAASEGHETNLESVVWSRPLDFTGGRAWAAGIPLSHGHAVRPSGGSNGFQYLWNDYSYSEYAAIFPAIYTPGMTGTVEPSWPTVDGQYAGDANGAYICVPNVGNRLTLDAPFLVDQIGIVIFDAQGVTAQPSVSFGVQGDNVALVANTQTAGLSQNGAVQLFTPGNPRLSNTLTVSINTLATGTRLLGQVFFKGFYCPHWL